jgi:malate dehydrogenase (oxaloacetate-decarboxylating)
VVIFGAGTAGIGIADQLSAALVAGGLSDEQARARFWTVDRTGLVTTGDPGLSEQQRRYARDPAELSGWERDPELGGVSLAEVVRRVHPTILVGTSGRTGAFSKAIVTDMAAHADRPVIMPMSNPTSLAEALPADLIRWSDGRALVAAGSPFGPVDYAGTRYIVGQANNALVFPGLGMGIIAVRASRVTEGMLSAAAHAVASLADTTTPGAPLLPRVESLRETSIAVATAVAQAAMADGVAARTLDGDVSEHVRALMWQPVYRPVRPG